MAIITHQKQTKDKWNTMKKGWYIKYGKLKCTHNLFMTDHKYQILTSKG